MINKSEDQYIEEMIQILKEKLKKDYKPGSVKRDAHPKCLGLLKATFVVSPNLDDKLKVGIFKEGSTYPALIRISNSSPKINGDNKKDVRGFAIKLLDVDGARFISDEKNTQDFLLVSAKTMPLGTVKLFYDAIYYNLEVNPLVYLYKTISQGNLNKLKEVAKLRKHHTSPLDISYYSTTPYSFGNKYVKYSIIPTSNYKSKFPKKLTSTYLTNNMQTHLKNNIATFDFMIQFRKNNMPLDDASVEWDEKISPYIKVAEIRIDKQDFISLNRYDFAEKLSYSPAHSLMQHKPIGGLNKARCIIYKDMSIFRHKRNNQRMFEPSINDYNTLV